MRWGTVVLIAALFSISYCENYFVSNEQELEKAVQVADVGDVVLLSPGKYFLQNVQPVILRKNIKIQGLENEGKHTILDCGSSVSALRVESSSIIQHMTIQSCQEGLVVNNRDENPAIIEQLRFYDVFVGVLIESGGVSISHSHFSYCADSCVTSSYQGCNITAGIFESTFEASNSAIFLEGEVMALRNVGVNGIGSPKALGLERPSVYLRGVSCRQEFTSALISSLTISDTNSIGALYASVHSINVHNLLVDDVRIYSSDVATVALDSIQALLVNTLIHHAPSTRVMIRGGVTLSNFTMSSTPSEENSLAKLGQQSFGSVLQIGGFDSLIGFPSIFIADKENHLPLNLDYDRTVQIEKPVQYEANVAESREPQIQMRMEN